MKRLILLLFVFFSVNAIAQYPFEKYPKIKYHPISVNILNHSDTNFAAVSARYKGYHLKINQHSGDAEVLLYFKNHFLKKITADIGFLNIVFDLSASVYAADIDGNGLLDFKLATYNNGSGLAGSLMHKLYLFNMGHNKYKAVSYTDFSNYTERDLNGDGRFEIITQNYLSYKNHSYWLFDLYNFKNGSFVKVSHQSSYPILIQFLERDNYKVTKHVSRKKMKQFSIKALRDFKIQ